MVAAVSSMKSMETRKQRLRCTYSKLKTDRTRYESLWREIDRYILPDRCQFQVESDHNNINSDGTGYSWIIDSSATMAIRTCAAGLHTGITSPARPWFELSLADKNLMKSIRVRSWLEDCRDRMLDAFRASNLYNVLPVTYGNVAAFGIDATVMEEDDETVFRFENLAIGTYYVSTNARRQVDCIFRDLEMTIRQVVEKFGIDNVSEKVKQAWDNNERENEIKVIHCVCPNEDYDPNGIFSNQKKYLSTYWEECGDNADEDYLSEKGFDSFPVLVPRWEVTGRNSYGQGPGKMILGDVKALQAYERRSAEASAKMNNPPMLAPASMEGEPFLQVAGGITYYDETQQAAQIKPMYERGMFDMQGVELKANGCRSRISRGTFEDLFLLISQSDRRQITAEEIRAKQEEKILQLGPPLENLNDDLLDRLIDRGFQSMLQRGLLPPPPEEVQGHTLVVQYVSTLAQVQKLLGVGALDRYLGTIGNLAQAKPQVLDLIDEDKVALEYHEMLGVTHRILRDEDKVKARRDAREQAQAQAAAQAQAMQQAEGAELLSKTDTRGQNALTDIIHAQSGAA